MDLKGYYRKIREIEGRLEEEFPIIRSLATEDGGRAGRLTEVPRAVAARMLAEGVAEPATAEEVRDFHARVEKARKAEEQRQKAAQIQFTILSEADLQSLQKAARGVRKE